MTKTALYSAHKALGAKIVDFHGWEMPLQYTGILEEHKAVREAVGVFDVSHMGRIEISGPEAEQFIDRLTTNVITGKKEQQAIYSVLCRKDGTSIDDVIVLRHSPVSCSVVSNASNRERVFQHISSLAKKVIVTPSYMQEGILAVQGPQSLSIVEEYFPELKDIPSMRCLKLKQGILSRTGYTGEKGIELFASFEEIERFWKWLMSKGVKPVGLGARDTLRLEKGYALYGHELSDTIAPTESVSAWAVKLQKETFLGKEALIELEKKKRHQYGVVLEDPGIARAECKVFKGEEPIGVVTSGTFSPSLKKSICIVMVTPELAVGDIINIHIRDKPCRAHIVQLPFL